MILVTIASMPTSSEGMTEFRPAHFALLKQKCLLTLTVGKQIMLLKVKKQALYWKFKSQKNQVSRYSHESSFELICLSYRSMGS